MMTAEAKRKRSTPLRISTTAQETHTNATRRHIENDRTKRWQNGNNHNDR